MTAQQTVLEVAPMRALRVVAATEGISFVVLLVSSVFKRTTSFNAVPVTGAAHGTLFLALLVLVAVNWQRLQWATWFALVMVTVGSPGAHFAVRATRTD